MSDETTPKLRLRPKLAGAPPAVTPAPLKPSAEAHPTEEFAPAPEVKPVALRSKLSLKAEEPGKAVEPPQIILPPPEVESANADPEDPRAFPPPAKPVMPTIPPRLRPASTQVDRSSPSENTGAAPPFSVPTTKERLPAVLNAPPPPRSVSLPKGEETWPAILNAPPPPGLAPAIAPLKPEEEPAEITAIRKASSFPFPPPTAKFPPLPGLSTSVDSVPPEISEQEGLLKKLLLIGVLLIVLLAAAAFGYFKYFAKPTVKPTSPPAPVADRPLAAPGKTKDRPSAEAPVPSQESVIAHPTPAVVITEKETPAPNPALAQKADAAALSTETTVAQEPTTTPEPAPVAIKAPPPQPSLAFKAWVINLRIRGVRGGDAQRVFIDKTSYVPGDVVNQQLGIVFVGYDENTRLLTFQDKSGATFERRH